ncbi:disease resistance protein rga2-like [Trifolium pratense]|uniref:Disease resistance protein rga2-like n=1 Tax=Trifolium pratense TaxID=57577 RepID=A0A2K3PLN1_TRIPR|nr:disease resistance protein rga2-like [Trifolium pratense]
MAESFVFDVANSLLGKLASYTYEEASRAYGLYEDLQRIKDTLSIVRDVFDGFELQDKKKQVLETFGSTRMKVRHYFSSSNPLAFRFKMYHQIKEIKDRLDKVAADGTREDDKEAIIQLLGESNPQGDSDKSLCVIPIVGIGGLGKTTLANITPPSVGCTVIAQQEDINHFDIEQLQISLRNKLSGQKFILVLDDIWNDDRAKWIELIDLIKVGAAESKIIVTTRINSIASMMGIVPSYVLEGLSPENCLTLFVKWAFKDGEEEQYPNLVEIGKEIVKKCAGVPLAVRTLGSSLFSKFDLNKWLFVRDHEIWNLEQKKDDILPALKLSYDEMPSYMRQCFAYFSLFPKDYTFNVIETTVMWIGLGLVQSMNGSEKLEHIAREYIHELHSRSLFQDFNDFGYDCDFKMHDLIYDLALYGAKEEFVRVDSNTRNISEQARHLSIIENDSLEHVLFPMSTSVRTILLFSKGAGLDNEALLDTWVSRYKLDIIGCPQLLNLPSDIHHLTALKELHIAGCPELCRKCKPQFGEYWPIIAHIENVFIELIGEEEEEEVDEKKEEEQDEEEDEWRH